jgi:hypothetical protein
MNVIQKKSQNAPNSPFSIGQIFLLLLLISWLALAPMLAEGLALFLPQQWPSRLQDLLNAVDHQQK